jgi:hypothetical protein
MQSAASPDSPKLIELMKRFVDARVPLERATKGDEEAGALARRRPDSLFAGVRSPGGALAGLLLIAGCWAESHEVASGLDTPEGCYWHALIHRMEPDTWNSNYWFKRVGQHPLFPTLLERARAIAERQDRAAIRLARQWDDKRFNELCEEARMSADAAFVKAIEEIHSVEVHLLWDWCLTPAGGGANG